MFLVNWVFCGRVCNSLVGGRCTSHKLLPGQSPYGHSRLRSGFLAGQSGERENSTSSWTVPCRHYVGQSSYSASVELASWAQKTWPCGYLYSLSLCRSFAGPILSIMSSHSFDVVRQRCIRRRGRECALRDNRASIGPHSTAVSNRDVAGRECVLLICNI